MSNQNENQPAQTAVTVAPRRELRVVEDNSAVAYLMDTARFDHSYRIAGAMARASLIPKHLQGESFEQTQANCFLIVNQALRWQFDPFAVAPETYEVGGKLGFSGKLVAAVINVRGGLVENLKYTFNDGKGDDLEVTVSGQIVGEAEPRIVTLSVRQAKTGNQMWTKDPQQKLIYSGATKWARRHKPEVILGVLTDDDAEAIRDEARAIAARPVKSPQFGIPGSKAPEPTTAPQDASKPIDSQSEPSKEPKTLQTGTQEAGDGKSEAGGSSDGDLAPQTGTQDEFKPRSGETVDLTNLRFAMHRSGVSEEAVIVFCHANSLLKIEQKKLSDLSTAKIKQMITSWDNVSKTIINPAK